MEKYKVTINNKVYEVEVEKIGNDTVVDTTPQAPVSNASTASADSILKSPIQGNVLKVVVKPNQTVKRGETLLIIEAMKLENEIVSDRDGVIENVFISESQVVDSGEDLISFRG